jgi:excisionase family DNA binding protein
MSRNQPFTTGQAAKYCHVSQATIINWIKEGKLKGYTTPGGHYRIPRSDLIAFLKRHAMPIDAALKESARPELVVLSSSPRIRDLARELGGNASFDVFLVTSDYAASAEAVRAKPRAVIIDTRTASDPLGLCQWLSETGEDIVVLIVGDGDDEATARSAGADVYLRIDALPTLKAKLEVLLT